MYKISERCSDTLENSHLTEIIHSITTLTTTLYMSVYAARDVRHTMPQTFQMQVYPESQVESANIASERDCESDNIRALLDPRQKMCTGI